MLRLAAALILVWVLGFAAFVVLLPGPARAIRTDAIVVPTGGPGRIARGGALLKDGLARRMLVSGADPSARPATIASRNGLPPALFACCVDLGHEAVDTRSNADETAAWLARRGYTSVRLVTTDWHMPRARFELDRAVAPGTRVVADAVESHAGLGTLMREYHKYLLRRIAVVAGL